MISESRSSQSCVFQSKLPFRTNSLLGFPTDLVQLLIGFQRKAEIVGSRVGQGFVAAGNLTDNIEVVFLRLFIDGTVGAAT